MKLAIISHTEHYKLPDGSIVGWSPTVNEINHVLEIFDEVYHIAMLSNEKAPLSVMPYSSDKITFIPIPSVGGKTIGSKLNILFKAPQIIKAVSKTLKKVDVFQLRTPTGIGVFLIPYVSFFIKKKGWFKYAGNWNQSNAPLGYALQRSMLKSQNRKVTINGKWDDQPNHCITFENPCLTVANLLEGQKLRGIKKLDNKLTFCFVGRLERQKGVERIIKAFSSLTNEDKSRINEIHFVGDGKEKKYFKNLSNNSGVAMQFHGSLPREEVFNLYMKSHFFLLPSSASEGFPKVIAEAANFGCIPIVSNVSAIAQYIHDKKNGFVLSATTDQILKEKLKRVLHLPTSEYKRLLSEQDKLVEKFTFSYYNKRIVEDILKDN